MPRARSHKPGMGLAIHRVEERQGPDCTGSWTECSHVGTERQASVSTCIPARRPERCPCGEGLGCGPQGLTSSLSLKSSVRQIPLSPSSSVRRTLLTTHGFSTAGNEANCFETAFGLDGGQAPGCGRFPVEFILFLETVPFLRVLAC